jgi:hypothetical protein
MREEPQRQPQQSPYPAEEARGGEIILRTPLRRMIFFGGLVGAVILVPLLWLLTTDETGKTLPAKGAPWRQDGSVELEAESTFMGLPLNEVLGTIQITGYFIWVTTPQ